MYRRRYTLVIVSAFLLVLLSACGVSGSAGTVPTATPKPLAALDLLHRSSTLMNKLKTLHLSSSGMTQVNLSNLPASSSTSPTSLQEAINQKFDSDRIFPDQSSTTLTQSTTVGTQLQNTDIKEIVKNNKLYIQNQRGVWSVLDESPANSALFNSQGSEVSKLIAMAEKGTLSDSGYETIKGVKLRHITSALTKDAMSDQFNQVSQVLIQLSGSQTSQAAQDALNNTKLSNAQLDLWIDEGTSYIHRAKLQFTMNLDMSSLVTPTPGSSAPTMMEAADQTTDYSAFDKHVTITPATNAQPVDNILQAIQ